MGGEGVLVSDHNQIFAFETDFAGSLRCIPMAVRLKLDLCGVKLSLRQWSQFTRADRAELLDGPCETGGERNGYRDRLMELIAARTGEPAVELPVDADPEWLDARQPPARLCDYAAARGLEPPTPEAWGSLPPLRRFALFKLTRPGHDNDNFVPAMREFGLAGP